MTIPARFRTPEACSYPLGHAFSRAIAQIAKSVKRHAIRVRCGFGKSIIADSLKKGRLDYGYVSEVDLNGRAIFVADAYRGDNQRFIVRADEKLTAFFELERQVSKDAKG